MKRTALVIGATGLVGSELVKQLLERMEFTEVKVFGRRIPEIKNPKLNAVVVDFDKPSEWQHELKGEVLFSTLGTTIKKAGSKKKQYQVDYTYQFETAESASQNKVPAYVLVSSLGANSKSRVFYQRIKGELDDAVMQMGFETIHILRPSALLGQRQEERAGENIMIRITTFVCKVFPFLKKYQPIPAETVAAAMINLATSSQERSKQIVDNPDIFSKAEDALA